MSLALKVQQFLNDNGFDCGKVDGLAGNKTFGAIERMKDALKGPQVTGNSIIKMIREKCNQAGFDSNQTAYTLATVEHETGGTFKMVREAYYISNNFDVAEKWRKKNLKYYGSKGYYGRGPSQLTWRENYEKFTDILSKNFGYEIDLVNNPDLALEPEYGIFILVYGMKHGTFTGKKISDYINDNKVDFKNARRVINGLDKATHIAKLAKKYI